MRRVARWGFWVGVVMMLAHLTGAGVLSGQQPQVAVKSGWVKLPAPGETTAAAFVVVDNPTMYDTYLMSPSTDVAGKVEFRAKSQGTDVEGPARESVTVPAFESISMDPNGVHLLLSDLKRPLKEGETITLMLTNERSAVLKVSAVVRKE